MYSNYKAIPYRPDGFATSFNRVIVKPIPDKEVKTEAGLIIPSDINNFCSYGEAYFTCESSCIKKGDKLTYKKLDRTNPEHLDVVSIDGETYDVLYENEIWAVNDRPINRIFVEPTQEQLRGENGLILPNSVLGVTEKGIVYDAPEGYAVKIRDRIEYRKEERDVYPTIFIDGKRYHVLFEADIYLVNGQAAPDRILVRIDKIAQKKKRETTETGLIRSQLFIFMLFNMQLGEVVGIGKNAKKIYPTLHLGDSVILHHSIESQDYRLIRKVYSKKNQGVVTHEDRTISAFSPDEREIFGRIVNRQKMIISEFGKNRFLKWNFTLYVSSNYATSPLLDVETNIDKCKDLEDLKSVIDHKKQEGIGKAQAKFKGLSEAIARVNPNTEKEKFDSFESQLNEAKSEAAKVAGYLNYNHLVRCTDINGYDVLTTYKELYPINILGHKYLIASDDYIVAKIHNNNMDQTIILPHADRLLVRPIEEDTHGELLIPSAIRQKPQKGTVLKVGPGKDGKELSSKEGDIVLFRRESGTPIEINGEQLLLLREGIDTIATLEK